MRPVLLAAAVIAGAVEAMGAGAADAQCSVFSRHPCVPGVCSVFSRRPCVPESLYPYGEDLRLTPLPFSAGLGDAVAGRPIAIRYVDDRSVR